MGLNGIFVAISVFALWLQRHPQEAAEPARNLHNEVDHSGLSLDERRCENGNVLNVTVRSYAHMPGRNLHELAVAALLDLALVVEVLSQFSLRDTSLQ